MKLPAKRPVNLSVALFGATLTMSSSLFAQDETSVQAEPGSDVVAGAPVQLAATQVTTLAPVVVVGTRHPRAASDVVNTVSVIEQEDIEQRQVFDLTDLVREEPGVSVDADDTRFGSGGFRIRGIGGNRVLTLVDMVPVADRFFVGEFADSGRDFLDVGMIGRVEILRGPASVLYGSQAIGGVVSMHTLSPQDLLRGEDNAYRVLAGYRGDRNGGNLGVQGAWGDEHNAFLVAAGGRYQQQREPADFPDSLELEDREQWRKSLLLKQEAYMANDARLTMVLDIDDGRTEIDMQSLLSMTHPDYVQRFGNTTRLEGNDSQSRTRASVHYEFYPAEETRVAWRAYTQTSKVQQVTEEDRATAPTPVFIYRQFSYDSDLHGLGVDVQQGADLGGLGHLIGYGLEVNAGEIAQRRDGFSRNLNDGTPVNMPLNEVFPRRDFPITKTVNAGVYLNDEIALADSSLFLIPGVRYDYQKLESESDLILENAGLNYPLTELEHDRVSANLGLRWPATDALTFSAQYAQGFRAPPPEDVNLVLFYQLPFVTVTSIPNPDLKPETSEGYELGVAYESPAYALRFSAFDNYYEDFIQSRTLVNTDPGTTPPTQTYQSINIDRVRIYGAELRYLQQLGAWNEGLQDWSFEVGAEWLRGENRETDEPLNDVGPPRAVLALQWEPTDNWSARAVSTFVRRHDRLDEPADDLYSPAGYAVHDLTVDYRFAPDWTMRAGVFNVADKKYYECAAVSNRVENDPLLPYLAASGRHLSLGIEGRF